MKGHPSKKEIIGAALDAARMTGPLRYHLSSCPGCCAMYKEGASILVPSGPELLSPPEGSLERIVAAGRARHIDAGAHPHRSWKETLLRPVPVSALAAVLAAVIIIPLFFLLRGKQGDDMVPAFDMTLTRVEGSVPRTISLAPSDTVMTSVGKSARIQLDELVDISLEGGSHFSVEKALRDRSGGKRRLSFILAHGSLQARLRAKSGIEAVFITPHGRVTALGTEFRLAVTGGNTSVLLREGALSVESASGEKNVITGGMKCTMNGGITKAPMNAADFAAFDGTSPPPKAAGSAATNNENAVSTARPADEATGPAPGDNAPAGNGVHEKTSRPAVREEMKNELRDAKEMRRSMRRGQK